MRVVGKLALALIALLCVGAVSSRTSAAQSGGLTLTPATLTLTLAPGSTEQTAEFEVTNQYDTPLGLTFAFERPLNETSPGHSPAGLLSISKPEVTLAPKTTLRQTVTLRDNKNVRPGSQLADLVVTTASAPGSDISVRPSVRMPIIVIKQAGAVTSVKLADFSGGVFRLAMPGSMTATIENDGNMVAIPRGTITVTGPGKAVMSKGVVNISSQAVSPGGRLTLETPMDRLSGAFWPGMYRVNFSYGLGGGQEAKTTSDSFLYIAWWHVAVFALLAYFAYRTVQRFPQERLKKRPAHPPPRTDRLAKRSAS